MRERARSGRMLVAAAAVVIAGCGSGGAKLGSEGADCRPDGGCNAGLTCFSGLCVRYDGGGSNDDVASSGVGGSGAAAGDSGAAGSTDAAASSDVAGTGAAGTAGTGAAGAGGTGAGGTAGTGAAGANVGGADGGSARDASADVSSSVLDAADDASGEGPMDAAPSDAGADASCVEASAAATPESFTAQACGYNPGTTTSAYGGVVRLTVSGVLTNTPGNPLQDGFYNVDPNDTTKAVAACPDCLRYNRFAEGTCVCASECASTSHRAADLLVGAYPAFEPSHVYTVGLDLGAASDRLDFGMADCGCGDNSGTYALSIVPASVVSCGP